MVVFESDYDALQVLGLTQQLEWGQTPRFGLMAGVIYPVGNIEPTKEEMEAIFYLCDEWDFGYDKNFIHDFERENP